MTFSEITKIVLESGSNLIFHFEIQPRYRETDIGVFVGGNIGRVTPVPIPNTVVKPAEPMILLPRESRSLPALNKNPGPFNKDRGSFVFRICIAGDQYSNTK